MYEAAMITRFESSLSLLTLIINLFSCDRGRDENAKYVTHKGDSPSVLVSLKRKYAKLKCLVEVLFSKTKSKIYNYHINFPYLYST